ncbi:MAG: GlsB/YeaQ/YmgE family stress response membrane protein [Pirellulales bacterium]
MHQARLGRQQPRIFFLSKRQCNAIMNVMEVQLAPEVQQWVDLILIWVGFGTLVGLMAKAVMPGRDPGGAVATLAMGVGGTIIGCGVLTYFSEQRITPVSLVGFFVATAGAFVLLFFYRLLGGRLFREGDRALAVRAPRAQRRRVYTQIED